MKKFYLALILFMFTAPAALQSREFLNTVVHLNFGGMYTFATAGDIIDFEEKEIKDKISDSTNVSHYSTAYCATLDIVPTSPIILGMEDHAIKFGVRGTYGFHYIQQSVTTGIVIDNQMMDYHSWMVGPVIHYAPFIEPSDLNEDYTASAGFTFYALYGRIDGNLTAYPSLRKKDIATGDYSAKITGFKIDIGFGAEIALCSLNVGMNIYYSYIELGMDKTIYSDLGKNGYIKEGCLEIYVGIPIESFIEPLIPKF